VKQSSTPQTINEKENIWGYRFGSGNTMFAWLVHYFWRKLRITPSLLLVFLKQCCGFWQLAKPIFSCQHSSYAQKMNLSLFTRYKTIKYLFLTFWTFLAPFSHVYPCTFLLVSE
jgi:hypothetical protein